MRLRIEYGDHNTEFEKLLPRLGTVERTVPAADSKLTWHLLKLDEPIQYNGATIDRFMVAARWKGTSVGDAEPTSVFILVVPANAEVGHNFSTGQFDHVAWGMAHALGT